MKIYFVVREVVKKFELTRQKHEFDGRCAAGVFFGKIYQCDKAEWKEFFILIR